MTDGGSLTRNRLTEVLRYTVFWLKMFLNMTGLLNPGNRRKYLEAIFCWYCMILDVYPPTRPWDFVHSGV